MTEPPFSAPPPSCTLSRFGRPRESSWLDRAPLAPSARAANGWGAAHHDRGFASYRSAGGHAAAQVIVPGAELAELGTAAVLAPMRALLGAWRAALEA